MLTILRSKLGISTGTLLAVLTMAACDGSSPAQHAPRTTPHTSTAPTAKTSSTVTNEASAVATQWMQQFCSSPAAHAAGYIVSLKEAVELEKPRVGDLEGNKEQMLSTAGGFKGEMVNNAKQLAATTPPKSADAAGARRYLLDVYHRLNQDLSSVDKRLRAIPTTNVSRFMAAFTPATTALIATIKRSQQEIQSHPILGPAFNTLDCFGAGN
ncbi:hypothetical protein [Actinomadura chibensis]|uniref:Lipoprotein n=1 Tax=Actinomadura chibensis TaxID=392828 RepID=A0A5D0NMN7_9ACTN|nr:hypothetical protein [Actinomadura chibensis]TYB45722.1 hypothetical protein FXF69_20135 [Actinomadura chibensis]